MASLHENPSENLTQVESLSIDSRLSQLGLVAESARAMFAPILDEQETNEIQLSVIEAVTNVIEHAYCYEEGHKITVDFSIEPSRILVEIIDWGKTMDPEMLNIESEVFDFDSDDIDSLPEGGMGLEIIKTHMDIVEYESISGKNVFRLIKSIGSSRQSVS